MNIDPQGRLARMDRAALNAVDKIQRPLSWSTWSIAWSFWAYLITVVTSALAGRFLPPRIVHEWGLGIVALPLLTLLLNVCTMYWVYRASDEYLRQRMLKCAAVVGVILAFATLGYFLLEQFGYPHLSMIVVNLVGWSLFIVLMLWVRYRAR